MTTEPYVPNLATAESAYVHWALLSDRGIDAPDASDEFDRFLAKIKADAIRSFGGSLVKDSDPETDQRIFDPWDVDSLANQAAQRIEGEA